MKTKVSNQKAEETAIKVAKVLMDCNEEGILVDSVKVVGEDPCLIVVLRGLVGLQSLVAIGNAFGDDNIGVTGVRDDEKIELYIIPKK